jgi:hypothetical protein
MNVVNVAERLENAMFMPYAIEIKGCLNVMNVVGKYFDLAARRMPKLVDATDVPDAGEQLLLGISQTVLGLALGD